MAMRHESLHPARLAAVAALTLTLAAAPSIQAAAGPRGAAVDLQFSLCETPSSVETALGLQPRGAPFKVWLFDDPALALFAKGLRIRLRETPQGADLTLKAADQDCTTLHPTLKDYPNEGKCEFDLHGTRIMGALSLTSKLDAKVASDLAVGRVALEGALSPAQTRFLKEQSGAWPLPAGVRALGPTRVTSYRAKNKPYLVDVSELPGGERFIEISRKVAQADAPKLRDRLEADLTRAGLRACADQSAQAANKLRALLRST